MEEASSRVNLINLGTLRVGQIVRSRDRLWRVGLVNLSRARIDPISGYASISVGTGRAFTSYGTSDSIGPESQVEIVDRDTLSPGELARLCRLEQLAQQQEDYEMAVAAPPGTESKSKAQLEKERKERLAAEKEKRKEDRAAKAAAPKEPKPKNKCKCGCGGETTGYFVPGHDARFKSWLLQIERGEKKPEDLMTADVRGSYKWKKTANGKGLIPTTNYKGEAWNGFEQEA